MQGEAREPGSPVPQNPSRRFSSSLRTIIDTYNLAYVELTSIF